MMEPKIICFGETLWDIFPNKKVIGGAPLNVALRLHSFGAKVLMISRIGRDDDGKNLVKYLENQGLETSAIQIDEKLPTGNVQVHLDKTNTASYTISEPVAWDHIIFRESDVEEISKADAFIFGSLSRRNKVTEATLDRYLNHAIFKVFDANLRPPFVDMESVFELMKKADLIKLNEEELEEIMEFKGHRSDSITDLMLQLSQLTQTAHICITMGAKGAVFYTNGKIFGNSGYKVIVKDTVGAGDSFLASLIYNFVKGNDPQKALDRSCAIGSLVASKEGANATVTQGEINTIISVE